jgi:hypothetical protein
MTPQDVEALLDRLAPAPPPPLEDRILRAVAPPPARRAFGIAAVAASVLVCLGVTWLIVAPPAPSAPGGAQPSQVDDWMTDLRSDDIGVRDRAYRRAVEFLRKDPALRDRVKESLQNERDPELRARLKGMIDEASERPYRVKPVEKRVLDLNVNANLCDAAFSSNSLRLAAIFFDGSMVLWSMPDAKEIIRTNVRRQGQHVNCDMKKVAFTPEGSELVVTDALRRIAFYDAETLKFKRSIDARQGTPSNWFPVAVHPDGRMVAWAEGMTTVVIGTPMGIPVSRVDLNERLPKPGAQVFVSALKYSADGKQLIAAGGHLAFVLDSVTLKTVTLLEDYQSGLWDACFAGAEGYAVTNSGSRVTVWDLADRKPVASSDIGGAPVATYYSMFHAAGPWIFTSGGGKTQHLFAFRPKSRELIPLATLSVAGEKAFVSPDGAWLLLQKTGEWKKVVFFRMEPE